MLTIQPKVLNNYRPTFKSSEDFEVKSIDISTIDEDTYVTMREELENQRSEFEALSEDKEIKIPKALNKALKGGTIVTTGLLGGMATGWGAKKSIAGLEKLGKTKAVQGSIKQMKDCKIAVGKSANAFKTEFLKSNFYTKLSTNMQNKWESFGEKKIGKPIYKFFNALGSDIKKLFKTILTGIKHVWNKIRGVKKATWEKATVNTVGVSGGIASGVTAIKENDKNFDIKNKVYEHDPNKFSCKHDAICRADLPDLNEFKNIIDKNERVSYDLLSEYGEND